MLLSVNADDIRPYISQYDEGILEGERFRLFQTHELRLMSSSVKYNQLFCPEVDIPEYKMVHIMSDDFVSRKKAVYILELSCPKSQREGNVTLENIMFTTPQDIRKGRFTPIPHKKPPKQIFDKYHAGPEDFPLLRQKSVEDYSMQQYQVACRLTTDPNIPALFVVYPQATRLDIPMRIDLKTYEQLKAMRDVILFRQQHHIHF